MAKIEKSEVVQQLIEGLRLNQGEIREVTTKDIIPTYNANPKIKILYFASPASVGSKYITVPNGKKYKLKSIYLTTVTSATVGNRNWAFTIYNVSSGNIVYYQYPATAQTASTTRNAIGLPNNGGTISEANSRFVYGLPDMWIPAGWYFGLTDNNGVDVAADTIAMKALVEEMPDTE